MGRGGGGPKIPLDQIFHLLYQEYGRDDVNALVAERLRTEGSNQKGSLEHKIIARLSSDQEGNPQIVTTNFDRLFEHALEQGKWNINQPPSLPDVSLGVLLTGITYLHGRLQEPGATHHPYVLSSADFGRAYLSEGWATNFIRSLLGRYTVVLLGYQAEDPPVKYLLQGLNHDGLSDRSNLYVFDEGRPEIIEAKWRDRGVTAIAYEDHSCLWQSLEAWADRADDPRRWRSDVVNLAMNGPRQLAAYERGQVAHIVRTTAGARLFAMADPAPPAEWLYVFDAFCRTAVVSKDYGNDAESFDPLEVYGLDDDPPRPKESERRSHRIHDHILEWRRGDTNPPTGHRLGGRSTIGFEEMPPRLSHLVNWISKHMDSPSAAFWVLQQNGLHPRLIERLHVELRQKSELHSKALYFWNLILEYQGDNRNFLWHGGWYELLARIKNEGWNNSVLRDYEAITAPSISYSRPSGIGESKPPFSSWEETSPEELGHWLVEFPGSHEDLGNIPDEILESVFKIAERHLFKAAELQKDLNTTYFTMPTCYPGREVDGQEPDRDSFINLFYELFARMVAYNPTNTRAHAIIWSIEDKYYFRKLKLFALNHIELFEADEAAEILLALSQECFWDSNVRRELLFLIHDRWDDFSEAKKIALGDRLLEGPARMDYWPEEEYPVKKDELACRYTRWMTLKGCDLTPSQINRLADKISSLPKWDDGYALGFVSVHHGRSVTVDTDESPDDIIDLPVNEVVEQAKANHQRDFFSFTERRPFTGLVKANPRKALASLSNAARKGDYPQEFWSTLMNDWPEGVNPRLFTVFLSRMGRLPDESIRELKHTVGRWIESRFLSAFKLDKDLAWKTFDHLVSGLISEEGIATGSGLGETRQGGMVVKRSRRTFGHAINGPIGAATRGMLHALSSLNLSQKNEIPMEFKSRLERLLDAPGEGGDHVVAILARHIRWLYYLDPDWVISTIMPWFNFSHANAEPAWNGYLSAAEIPTQEIGAKFKPLLLNLFPAIYQWSWDSHLATIATQIIVELAVFRNNKPDGLSSGEARLCLRNMWDRNRHDAIHQLGRIGIKKEGNWSVHVIPFINTVWPRERTFRTSTLVSSWVSMLEDTGNDFPAVLDAVRRFLVPVGRMNHRLYCFARDLGGKQPLTVKYPEAVLDLLDEIIPNSADEVS